jgi:hypothetical protein
LLSDAKVSIVRISKQQGGLYMRRIFLLFAVGALVTTLTATVASAQQEGESITATGELSSSAGPIAPAPDIPTFPDLQS